MASTPSRPAARSRMIETASATITGIVASVQHSLASSGRPARLAAPPAPKPMTAIATSDQRATRSIDIGPFPRCGGSFRSGRQAPIGMSPTSTARTIRPPLLRCSKWSPRRDGRSRPRAHWVSPRGGRQARGRDLADRAPTASLGRPFRLPRLCRRKGRQRGAVPSLARPGKLFRTRWRRGAPCACIWTPP